VSNAGGGISRYGDIAINRWRVDAEMKMIYEKAGVYAD